MRRGHDESDDRNWRDDSERSNNAGFAGSWRRVRPRFDDPMSWSVPVMRVARIEVRLHVFFLAYVAYMLLRAAFPAATLEEMRLSIGITAILIGTLFLVVLLHEFGHCIACRWWGGVADEVLLWPLGGLATCAPPQDWRAHFWTAAGGPLVNVLIFFITAPTLRLLTGRWFHTAIPSLIAPDYLGRINDSWGLMTLYLINWWAVFLLVFNLLPIFPLDGGRLLQALLWPRLGYARAMRWAVRAGYVGAILLGVAGIVWKSWTWVGIAIFGGLVCRATVKELDFTEEALGFEDSEGRIYAESLEASKRAIDAERHEDEQRRERDAARKASESAKRASEEAEFDRILDKIRNTGLGSLTPTERRTLERETERRRREGR